MRRLSAVAAITAFLALTGPAAAATINVTTGADAVTADTACSLREAIQSANTDTAFGGCTAGSGTDTIALPAGAFDVTIAGGGEDANATGDLDVNSNLDINGAGAANTVIASGGQDRILDVLAGKTVNVSGVTLTGGHAPDRARGQDVIGPSRAPGGGDGGNATGQFGGAGGDGGGIRNGGTLTVTDSIITDCSAGKGGDGGNGTGGDGGGGTPGTPAGAAGGLGVGGAGGAGGNGGAIENSSNGMLTVTRVTIVDTRAGRGGASGSGTGGNGGPGYGAGNGSGGDGALGAAGAGGPGGGGGAIWSDGPATIEDSTILDTHSGDGGPDGTGTGGAGGTVLSGSGSGGAGGEGGAAGGGGDGGLGAAVGASGTGNVTVARTLIAGAVGGEGADGADAVGGRGGDGGGPGGRGTTALGSQGGAGGGRALFQVTGTNVTLDGNTAGDGGDGGSATGGDGGTGFGTGAGGFGGDSLSGNGGSGGAGAAAQSAVLVHATVSRNHRGRGGSLGPSTGGHGGFNQSNVQANDGTAVFGGDGPSGFSAVESSSVGNSIFSANDAPACSNITGTGNNIDFPDSTCPGAVVDPKLGPLQDNGGPSSTRALLPGSAARDSVPASGQNCAATDQRGVTRPKGPACDAGAYEVAPPTAETGAATGVTERGATVSGKAGTNLRQTTFYFEYGTTTSYGSRTIDAQAAPGVEPSTVADSLDVLEASTTYHYRLVVVNQEGTAVGSDATFTTAAAPGPGPGPGPGPNPGPNPGPGTDTTKPVITLAKMSPSKWTLKKGATFSYTLSEAARVKFSFAKASTGRSVGGKCVKTTHSNRRRKHCTRYNAAGSFGHDSTAGANVLKFDGRVGGKALHTGKYRVTLVATDAAGNKSNPKTLAFRLAKR